MKSESIESVIRNLPAKKSVGPNDFIFKELTPKPDKDIKRKENPTTIFPVGQNAKVFN